MRRFPGGGRAFLVRVLTEHPDAGAFLLLLDTAKSFALPPSAFLHGTPAAGMTGRDLILLHAWTLYQASLCPDCGRPRDVCASGAWTVQTRVCGPSAAIEQWRTTNRDPAPGTRLTTVKASQVQVSETLATAPEWWLREHYPHLLPGEGGPAE